MSDVLLSQFVQRGTAAERAAFTPDPPTNPSGLPAHGYLFYETDTSRLYSWDGAAWDLVGSVAGAAGDVAGPGAATDNGLVRFDGTTGKVVQNTSGPTLEDTGRIANLVDPSSAQDAATKAYVDGVAVNLGKRARVRAATTANVTIATALNNGDTLDGVSLVTGDLVLVKDQGAPEENGVYVVGVSPARAAEFDTYDEYPGSLIAVEEGTANADTLWLCTSNVGGTLNTTALAFSALNVAGGINQLTGDVTAGPGTGSQASTIANDAVSNAKLANMAEATFKMRAAGAGTGDPIDGTAAQARTALDLDAVIEITIDGAGAVITTGAKTLYFRVPWDFELSAWEVIADQSGSIVIDLWKDTYANFPPTVADTIIGGGGTKPTLSSAQKAQSANVTGYTTSFSKGDYLEINVDSAATVTKVILTLIGKRST